MVSCEVPTPKQSWRHALRSTALCVLLTKAFARHAHCSSTFVWQSSQFQILRNMPQINSARTMPPVPLLSLSLLSAYLSYYPSFDPNYAQQGNSSPFEVPLPQMAVPTLSEEAHMAHGAREYQPAPHSASASGDPRTPARPLSSAPAAPRVAVTAATAKAAACRIRTPGASLARRSFAAATS